MTRVRVSSDNQLLPEDQHTPVPVFKPIRSQSEVARIMGLTKSQVTWLEERALKRLRILLKDDPRK